LELLARDRTLLAVDNHTQETENAVLLPRCAWRLGHASILGRF
jgi:hypothetical protein